jgi:cell division protein FtsI/penicillin-binding protein 2
MALKPNDDRLLLGFEPAHKPFTGRLKAPIVYSDQAYRERQEKLELLLEHYNINGLPEAKRWKVLACALAFDLVPGMHVLKRAPSKPGRPPTIGWRKFGSAKRLVEVIESIKLERKKGNLDAARIAIQRHPKTWPGITPQSLVSRYYEARKLLSDVEALLSDIKAQRP